MASNANEVVLTAEGKEKLERELQQLENEKRKEVGDRIREARGFGDISENSEYDDAKNEQAMVEQRIAEINQILSSAQVIDAPKRKGSKVVIGSEVTLVDEKGNEHVFKVVGDSEADASDGLISNDSPVGRAVMDHKKGDTIEYAGPTGRKMKFTLAKIGG